MAKPSTCFCVVTRSDASVGVRAVIHSSILSFSFESLVWSLSVGSLNFTLLRFSLMESPLVLFKDNVLPRLRSEVRDGASDNFLPRPRFEARGGASDFLFLLVVVVWLFVFMIPIFLLTSKINFKAHFSSSSHRS